MKKLLLLTIVALTGLNAVNAQITVTEADMPVAGDSLRVSFADATTPGIDLTLTGASYTWDFSGLVPTNQEIIQYKTPAQVNASYSSLGSAAAGYQIADNFAGSPVPITEVYTFLEKKTSPSRYATIALAAKINGTATPIPYSKQDTVYLFPLSYPHATDHSTYRYSYSLFGIGSLSVSGDRTTTVDGWGTLVTPHFTTPLDVIRVKSDVNEYDTVSYLTTTQPTERHYVEYKWLAVGEHYPALQIVVDTTAGSGSISEITFRDQYRMGLGIADAPSDLIALRAYPNPATDIVTIETPTAWLNFQLYVFDVTGKLVASQKNKAKLNVSSLAKGSYLVKVTSGSQTGYTRFQK